jgi:hypothetical protein
MHSSYRVDFLSIIIVTHFGTNNHYLAMKIQMIAELGFVRKDFFNVELVNVFRLVGYVMENGIVRMQVMSLVYLNNRSIIMIERKNVKRTMQHYHFMISVISLMSILVIDHRFPIL